MGGRVARPTLATQFWEKRDTRRRCGADVVAVFVFGVHVVVWDSLHEVFGGGRSVVTDKLVRADDGSYWWTMRKSLVCVSNFLTGEPSRLKPMSRSSLLEVLANERSRKVQAVSRMSTAHG